MIKKFISVLLIFSIIASPALAFVFEVPVLPAESIAKLSDGELMGNYIEVLVELEAVRTFYSKGGLIPKEYRQLKDLLRYRILLSLEIHKRKIDVPPSLEADINMIPKDLKSQPTTP